MDHYAAIGFVAERAAFLSVTLWRLVATLGHPPTRKAPLGRQLEDAVAGLRSHRRPEEIDELRVVADETTEALDPLIRLRNRVIHDWWQPDSTYWPDGLVGEPTTWPSFPGVWTNVRTFNTTAVLLSQATIGVQGIARAVVEYRENGLTRDRDAMDQPYAAGLAAAQRFVEAWQSIETTPPSHWHWHTTAPQLPLEPDVEP